MLCRSGTVPCHEREARLMKQTWLPILGLIVVGGAWALVLWIR